MKWKYYEKLYNNYNLNDTRFALVLRGPLKIGRTKYIALPLYQPSIWKIGTVFTVLIYVMLYMCLVTFPRNDSPLVDDTTLSEARVPSAGNNMRLEM